MKPLKQPYFLKPLRWKASGPAGLYFEAKSPGRNYRIEIAQSGKYVVCYEEGELSERFSSILKAKQAAQEDYYQRMLPHLQPLEIPKQELRSDQQLDRIIAEWRWGRIPDSDTSVSDTGPVYPRACKDPVACEEAEARMTDTERVHFVSMLAGDTPRHRAEALVKVIERYRKKERVSA